MSNLKDELYEESIKLYEEYQQKWIDENNVELGDTIVVKEKANRGEFGWWNYWISTMDGLIDKKGSMVNVDTYGIGVKFDESDVYALPFFCLEKVEEEKKPLIKEFKPYDKVLVRDDDSQDWEFAIFVKYENNTKYPYHVMNLEMANTGSYSQCKKYEE